MAKSINVNLNTVYSKVKKNDKERRANDFYPSPPISVYSLLKSYDNIPKRILEPCSGRGDIAYELHRNGYDVKATDLFRYDNSLFETETDIDFLKYPKQNDIDGIITNPPYHNNLHFEMLKKSISEYDFTAFLLRITFLESKERYFFFKENPPTKILVYSDRLGFSAERTEEFYMKKQLSGMICYAWYIWDKKTSEKNSIDWIYANNYYREWVDSLDDEWYETVLGYIPNKVTNFME